MNSMTILFTSFLKKETEKEVEIYDNIQLEMLGRLISLPNNNIEKYNMVEISDIKGFAEEIDKKIKASINFIADIYKKEKDGYLLYATLDAFEIEAENGCTYGEKIKLLLNNNFHPYGFEKDVCYIWTGTELGNILSKEGENN